MVRVEPLTLPWISARERTGFTMVQAIDDPDEGPVWRRELDLGADA